MYSNADFQGKPLEFMSRDEIYSEGLRRTTTAVTRKDELGDLVQDPADLAAFNRLACFLALADLTFLVGLAHSFGHVILCITL